MSRREYIIPFVGLKLGEHNYDFEIGPDFFKGLEYSIIESGSVNVRLVLEKKETMLIGIFECEGRVFTECDRCNGPVEVPIQGSFRLVFKFSSNESTDDESLIILPEETFELDVQPYIYELMTVSLPARNVHPKGECNEEMLATLSQYLVNPTAIDEEEDWDDEDWDDEDEDWDDEDWDEEEDDDDDFSDEEEEDGDVDPDRPIDPRWSVLKNLN